MKVVHVGVLFFYVCVSFAHASSSARPQGSGREERGGFHVQAQKRLGAQKFMGKRRENQPVGTSAMRYAIKKAEPTLEKSFLVSFN